MNEIDIFEFRRQKLEELLLFFYKGNASAFAKAFEVNPTYVTRMRYPSGKAGKKNIGDDWVQKIESKHPYWFLPGAAGNLVFMFMNMSQGHQDQLIGMANRLYNEDHPNDKLASPFQSKPKPAAEGVEQ